MLKTFNLIVAICIAIDFTANAQTNSVSLKDAAGTTLSTHNSITSAYAAIPSTLSQAYVMELDTSYKATDETFPVVFTNKAGASSTNTITLQVDTTMRSIPYMRLDSLTTDVFVLDNADWMIFDALLPNAWIIYANFRSHHNLFRFVNGASHNTIRKLKSFIVPNIGDTLKGDLVLFDTTTSGGTGNSFNTIEECSFVNGRLMSAGSINHKNEHITIQKSDVYPLECVVLGHGTGNVYLTSNTMHSNGAAIKVSNFEDSLFVTRNRIELRLPEVLDTLHHRGIVFSAGPNGGYLSCTNNMIQQYAIKHAYHLDSIFYSTDSATNVAGIEIGGINPVTADIYFNTVKLHGKHKTNIANTTSAAFLRTENNPASRYNVLNNIFTNIRENTLGTVKHLAIRLDDTSNLHIDYNAYNTLYPDFISLNATIYKSMADYKAAFTNANEQHSDSVGIEFSISTDMHLSATMYNNTLLQGINIPGMDKDFDNQPRVYPYRGADEFVITCQGVSRVPKVNINPYPICTGLYTQIRAIQFEGTGGYLHQWQSRPAGATSAFTDIPGANTDPLFTQLTAPMEYRVLKTCLSNGQSAVSDTVVLEEILPTVDSINMVRTGDTYIFYPIGVKNHRNYYWQYDTTQFRNNDTLVLHYKKAGLRSITLHLEGKNCGSDSVTLIFETLGVADILQHNMNVYPNPAGNILQVDLAASFQYTIADISGRLVLSGNSETGTIDIRSIAPGSYILHITTLQGDRRYGRFLKE